MSDKMLMENWRKFLVEEIPEDWETIPILMEKRARVEAENAPTVKQERPEDLSPREDPWGPEDYDVIRKAQGNTLGQLKSMAKDTASYVWGALQAAVKGSSDSTVEKWKDIANGTGVWARYVDPNKSHISGKCISIKDEIARIEQLQKDEEVPELMRKSAESMIAKTGEGIKDTIMVAYFGAAKLAGAGKAALLTIFGGGLKDGIKRWRQRKPTPKEIEKFPMATLLHLGKEFQQVINPAILDQIDEEYVQYLIELLEKGNLCVDDPKVMNINQWIQSDKGFGLCKKASEYTKSELLPGDISESKFHDNWRMYLLTEEKL